MKTIMSNKINDLFSTLTYEERDAIYRSLWAEHVKEDVESFCENIGLDATEEDIADVVYRYVYEGDYDCNISYWNNIENLLNEVMF